MMDFCQGDIIKIEGFKKKLFVVVSKNAFIKATGLFHVCLIDSEVNEGPIHIPVHSDGKAIGTVLCEQIKLIDPDARGCTKFGSLPYAEKMDVSDAVQGIFEYD